MYQFLRLFYLILFKITYLTLLLGNTTLLNSKGKELGYWRAKKVIIRKCSAWRTVYILKVFPLYFLGCTEFGQEKFQQQNVNKRIYVILIFLRKSYPVEFTTVGGNSSQDSLKCIYTIDFIVLEWSLCLISGT